jgi:hypothetical protein
LGRPIIASRRKVIEEARRGSKKRQALVPSTPKKAFKKIFSA